VGQSSLYARVCEQDGTLYPDTPFWMRWWVTDRQFNTPDDVIILTTTDSEPKVEFIGNVPSGRYRVEDPGGLFARITTTLDLLPTDSLTGSEFAFCKPSASQGALVMLPDSGDVDAAEQSNGAVIEADPELTVARYQRAITFRAAGDHKAAVADLRVVVEEEPMNTDALDQLGTLLIALGEEDEGREFLQRVFETGTTTTIE